jgi:hypothetical protein
LENGLGSMARNVKNGIEKDGLPLFEDRMREAEQSRQVRYVTADDIPSLAHDAVTGTLKRPMDASELTGEWIVYARCEGRNYYLCLGTHDKTQHDYLRKLIESYCCAEFPFLSTLLATAKLFPRISLCRSAIWRLPAAASMRDNIWNCPGSMLPHRFEKSDHLRLEAATPAPDLQNYEAPIKDSIRRPMGGAADVQ